MLNGDEYDSSFTSTTTKLLVCVFQIHKVLYALGKIIKSKSWHLKAI